MARKLAMKRLTASDLTFFEWQFKNENAGNQKAINLNADIFVNVLYPGLSTLDRSKPQRLPVDVFIYGPGVEGEFNIQRKIVKSAESKNWRLNGEFVYNPEDNYQRFNDLTAGDLAIFDFGGEVYPQSISVVFIANSISEDKGLHTSLDQLLGGNKMVALSPSELEAAVNKANPVKEHPIYELTLDMDTLSPDLEDIALGGSEGRERLIRRQSSRKMSHDDLQKAKESADLTGVRGEQFVNDYLLKLEKEGKIDSFGWVSFKNAINPYDFWVNYDGQSRTLIDVKSTQGEFDRTLHVSFGELVRMNSEAERYEIYRVFEMKESTAQLRIAEDVGTFARKILDVLNDLPSGIFSDSVSFSPTKLSFGATVTLESLELLEEDE